MYDHYDAADFGGTSSTHAHMKKVYAWMFIALLVTAGVAMFVANNFSSFAGMFSGPGIFVLIGLELVLVFVLAGRVHKMNPVTAFVLFMVYSILNGLTLSVIFKVYTPESIANTFLIASAMFGALSVYGFTTKRDMSGWGTFLFMTLIGLIVVGIVNIFIGSSVLEMIISAVGVLLFAGLTAYDTQAIKNEPFYRKHPVMGALTLYLDFINLFLHLLQFFGDD